MKVLFYILLLVLVFLAVSSGLSKVVLMPREVDFFSQYGFANPLLMAFGLFQLVGGIGLLFPKTRLIGAGIVALTFLISAVVLFLSGNILVTVVTLVFVGLLALLVELDGRINPSLGHSKSQ